jgi:hypothetical protein
MGKDKLAGSAIIDPAKWHFVAATFTELLFIFIAMASTSRAGIWNSEL